MSDESNPDDSIVIGVDAGGSKTSAWVVRQTDLAAGPPLRPSGHAEAGAGNLRSVGFERAIAAIADAVAKALERAGIDWRPALQRPALQRPELPRPELPRPAIKLCIAAAGAGRAGEQRQLGDWARQHFGASQVRVTDDAFPILAAASSRHVGIALIGGTGSYAWGRNARGAEARCGGWGYLFGDEGSGYAIGIAGLRAAARCADGRGGSTSLLKRFSEHFKIEHPSQLVDRVYGEGIDRREVARWSEIVFAASETDAVAQGIVAEAAGELAALVETLTRKLDFANDEPILALGGGLLIHQRSLREAVVARVGRSFASVQPVADPVVGAVRLAAAL